ncbi:hypothetical protein PC129_g7753 [Phytophthora cactorum]|uniref:Uncharacterized protein n=1 Tax=Phytophthora cactorum TaxID=29920 RepID=A0A8T1I8Y9_9STRA|nr:hypothetical protein PC112_g15853 [Phytophthora cactorum]KAG2857983.1 hypothetical protein PC113_g10210 [Phytophthora cactorum]KAG2912872.1 hypothetical protein PC114_g8743 [Phytophthora cactorum]KAG2941101.1 hypothetical protein PC117_g10312 [Phytophthora cactorum]KAG3008443.1 hypothetical protein PC120_g16221 [Phytophthora cactorum]
MHNLKRTYKSVKKWLEDKQQLELFFSGKAAKKVESAVFKRCPHFLDLSPVFENVGHISTAAEGEEHEENVAEGANELNEEDGGSVEDTGGAQGKRKRQGDPGSRSSKRGKQQISPPSSTVAIPASNQPGLQDTSVLLKRQSVLENTDGDSYRDGTGVAVTGKAGERMAQRLIDCELKHKEDLAKVRLDAEKKLAEVRTKLETMLSRQKLKSAGYSDEDVNGIFPL